MGNIEYLSHNTEVYTIDEPKCISITSRRIGLTVQYQINTFGSLHRLIAFTSPRLFFRSLPYPLHYGEWVCVQKLAVIKINIGTHTHIFMASDPRYYEALPRIFRVQPYL